MSVKQARVECPRNIQSSFDRMRLLLSYQTHLWQRPHSILARLQQHWPALLPRLLRKKFGTCLGQFAMLYACRTVTYRPPYCFRVLIEAKLPKFARPTIAYCWRNTNPCNRNVKRKHVNAADLAEGLTRDIWRSEFISTCTYRHTP